MELKQAIRLSFRHRFFMFLRVLTPNVTNRQRDQGGFGHSCTIVYRIHALRLSETIFGLIP